MYLHLRGIAVSTRYSCTYTRIFCTYEIQLHLRGTAAPTRYSCFYEVQLPPRCTAAPTRYSCTHEVQLYTLGTTVPYVRGTKYKLIVVRLRNGTLFFIFCWRLHISLLEKDQPILTHELGMPWAKHKNLTNFPFIFRAWIDICLFTFPVSSNSVSILLSANTCKIYYILPSMYPCRSTCF